MTVLLQDRGLDPRCPIMDRDQLGGGARFYDWETERWRPFPEQVHIQVPMRIVQRVNVRALTTMLASRAFKGGNVIAYVTDPPEEVPLAVLLASFKKTRKMPPYVPPQEVYLGLAYTRVSAWREILPPWCQDEPRLSSP